MLFDGGMGTELYKRGIFINKCYDEINLSSPELVRQVHLDYLKAGADVIETNTFGANRSKLGRYQLADKLHDINYQGALIASSAAGDYNAYVAGAVGPLGLQIEPLGPVSVEEARDYFIEQISALVEGGVDLLIFETFIYPEELKQAIKAARMVCNLPIISQITINEDCTSITGASPEVIIEELESFGADVIGINCTVGPQIMLNWLETARKLTSLPISVMPNAGRPKNIDGRNIYLTSPEYFGEYAKHFIMSGANIIGGCCGTTPEHIQRMKNAVGALSPNIKSQKFVLIEREHKHEIKLLEKKQKSRLARRLEDGRFVTFVELIAPRGVSAKLEIDKARELNYYGIDVINIPDGPRASARMSAFSLAVQIQSQAGIETVLHYACRDRNVIGIQSDLLGAWAMGLRNILAITGDPPKLGNYPDATAVFDVDSIGLVNILNRLNHAMDIAGNPIDEPSGFFVGVGANPAAINIDDELRRLDWKVQAGAEYIITQPVFDLKLFEAFHRRIEHYRIPLIAGLWPLASIRNAEFMNNEIPGCIVPDDILDRMRQVADSRDSSIDEGIKIARETLSEMFDMIQGVQISTPFGRIKTVVDVLDGFV